MKNCWVFEKNLNGLSDEILDDVIEFFDFPLEDVEIDGVEQDWDDQFKLLQEPSLGVFSVSSSELRAQTLNENAKHECSFSASLSKTAGTTYGKTIPIQNVSFDRKELHHCQTYSPVSVFEGGSSSVENFTLELPVILAKRPRGKRQRPSNSNPLFSVPFFSTSPSFQKCQRIDDSGLETQPAGKLLSSVNKKQRKHYISMLTSKTETKISSSQESVAPRKCMHCEMTKTPQWREGPMGPKTLCNACGVRYRSGRLFPEYRPAASPTFVASLHSNSHKVVLEMRNKATQAFKKKMC